MDSFDAKPSYFFRSFFRFSLGRQGVEGGGGVVLGAGGWGQGLSWAAICQWLFLPKLNLELMFSSIEPCAPCALTEHCFVGKYMQCETAPSAMLYVIHLQLKKVVFVIPFQLLFLINDLGLKLYMQVLLATTLQSHDEEMPDLLNNTTQLQKILIRANLFILRQLLCIFSQKI